MLSTAGLRLRVAFPFMRNIKNGFLYQGLVHDDCIETHEVSFHR